MREIDFIAKDIRDLTNSGVIERVSSSFDPFDNKVSVIVTMKDFKDVIDHTESYEIEVKDKVVTVTGRTKWALYIAETTEEELGEYLVDKSQNVGNLNIL